MGKSHAAAPAAAPSPRTWPKPKEMFSSARSIIWSVLFILFFAIDCAELGLVSQQIHNYGGQNRFEWPGAEVGHAMGLLLFASIFSLLFILFHWAMGLRIFSIVFLMTGVFWGTGAGIIYQTPFGHGLRCNDGAASFPANYQPFYSQCARWKAIEGLAWALFALSVFGLFYAIVDQFEFRTRRRAVYDIEQNANANSAEKANRASEETAVTAH